MEVMILFEPDALLQNTVALMDDCRTSIKFKSNDMLMETLDCVVHMQNGFICEILVVAIRHGCTYETMFLL